jgi:hypothetical protein
MISTLLVIISYIISRYYLPYIHFMVIISILKDSAQGPRASTAPRLPRARSTSLSRASPPRSTKQQATWRQELPKAFSSEPRYSLGDARAARDQESPPKKDGFFEKLIGIFEQMLV